ncbi:MAG: excinuclease ABC subunit UvrC [Desulfobacteraceae bacterium]|jgi:excinuclease ABC subunit C
MKNATSDSKDSDHLTQFVQQSRSLSCAPGVYLFKDRQGKILYVGKAKNLNKRVRSYFQPGRPHDAKTTVMVSKIDSLETVITHTEQEALILESNLIKQHRPRYNIQLKDDKRYPFLRLNLTQSYPNLNIVRKIKDDGARYFGPYASSASVRQTLKFIHKTFRLRKCRAKTFASRTRPCLNYQMGLCLGPCCKDVDPKQYAEIVDEVTSFLRGRTPVLVRKIEREMISAADQQDYEKAAMLRDKMVALKKTVEKQVCVTTDLKDRDVISLVADDHICVFAMLSVRGGYLLGGRQFVFDAAAGHVNDRMSLFLRQLYSGKQEIPAQVLVDHLPDDYTLIESYLSDNRGLKVKLIKPQRGEKARLIEMARQNAKRGLNEQIAYLATHRDLLGRIKNRLTMDELPKRIECFDNSNLAGTLPVSAMVVFEHGEPKQQFYRHYKITQSGKSDDYGHMAEVLSRRFKDCQKRSPLPDLLLVDGGKGQLNVALAVLHGLGLAGQFAVAGIAKKDETRGDETDKIYIPQRANPVNLSKDPDVLLFLQRIRDEAHRFAITYQRRRREKSSVQSVLDQVDGVGPKRKRSLLQHFGSIKKIKSATVEELCQSPGISQSLAQTIVAQLEKVQEKREKMA